MLGLAGADFMRPGDYMEGKIPRSLALATACVRLWTPILPWILRVWALTVFCERKSLQAMS